MICGRCGGPGWIGQWKCMVCNGHGEIDVDDYIEIIRKIREHKEMGRKKCKKTNSQG